MGRISMLSLLSFYFLSVLRHLWAAVVATDDTSWSRRRRFVMGSSIRYCGRCWTFFSFLARHYSSIPFDSLIASLHSRCVARCSSIDFFVTTTHIISYHNLYPVSFVFSSLYLILYFLGVIPSYVYLLFFLFHFDISLLFQLQLQLPSIRTLSPPSYSLPSMPTGRRLCSITTHRCRHRYTNQPRFPLCPFIYT